MTHTRECYVLRGIRIVHKNVLPRRSREFYVARVAQRENVADTVPLIEGVLYVGERDCVMHIMRPSALGGSDRRVPRALGAEDAGGASLSLKVFWDDSRVPAYDVNSLPGRGPASKVD